MPSMYDTSTYIATPVGVPIIVPSTGVPTGFLLCDGSSLLRTTYPLLFAAIGTVHGAIDGTHFNIPDYRGRFLRGLNNSTGRDPDAASRAAMAVGGLTGDNIGTTQATATQAHTHVTTTGSSVVSNSSTGVILTPAGGTLQNFTSSSFGGSTETRPLNINVNYCIRAF